MPPRDVWRKIEIQHADITQLDVEAIVNAANESLLGGGGVDGAIHRAAGPKLLEFCRTLGGCRTGDAKITPGFNLRSKFVIHTVGPVYRGGDSGEPELLASCYRKSLQLAAENAIKTIAFPAISTGVYSYPFVAATEIALRTVADELQNRASNVDRVVLVFFGPTDYRSAIEIRVRTSDNFGT